MTITAYQIDYQQHVSTVRVTSDLSGTIYYHFYLDGAWLGQSQYPVWTLHLEQNEQAVVECVDSNDADFDPIAGAPDGYPARKTLWWIRSGASTVNHYRVDAKRDSDAWATVAVVPHEDRRWTYSYLTDRLDDLTPYQWSVYAVDDDGHLIALALLDAETIVRTPDAPEFTVSRDDGTDLITFSSG